MWTFCPVRSWSHDVKMSLAWWRGGLLKYQRSLDRNMYFTLVVVLLIILLENDLLCNKSWNIEQSDVWRLSSPKKVKVRLRKFQNLKAKYPWPFYEWRILFDKATNINRADFYQHNTVILSFLLWTWLKLFVCASPLTFCFLVPCNLVHIQILKAARWSWMPARLSDPSATHPLTFASTQTSSPQVSNIRNDWTMK